MRINYVSNMYPSKEFPTRAVFIRTIENGLIENGAIITQKTVMSLVNVSVFRKLFEYGKFYTKILINGLLKNDYDLIYVNFAAQCAPPMLVIKYLTGKKIVLNVHGEDVLPQGLSCKLLLPFTSALIKYADLTVVPSNYFEKETRKLSANLHCTIFVSPSGGIDTTLFKPIDNTETYKKSIGLNCNEIVFGYVSRVIPGKGWELFLSAIAKLKQNNIPVRGIMVGIGEQEEKLRSLISTLKLDTTVLYLGSQDNKKLPILFNCMNAFVFPTLLAESFGLVAVEAMACGTIVVASRIGALTEYITDGENGYLVTPGDVEELAERLLSLCKKTDLQSVISENARQTAQKYDSKHAGYMLMNVLKKSLL